MARALLCLHSRMQQTIYKFAIERIASLLSRIFLLQYSAYRFSDGKNCYVF